VPCSARVSFPAATESPSEARTEPGPEDNSKPTAVAAAAPTPTILSSPARVIFLWRRLSADPASSLVGPIRALSSASSDSWAATRASSSRIRDSGSSFDALVPLVIAYLLAPACDSGYSIPSSHPNRVGTVSWYAVTFEAPAPDMPAAPSRFVDKSRGLQDSLCPLEPPMPRREGTPSRPPRS
jgi:hypothetical protein